MNKLNKVKKVEKVEKMKKIKKKVVLADCNLQGIVAWVQWPANKNKKEDKNR